MASTTRTSEPRSTDGQAKRPGQRWRCAIEMPGPDVWVVLRRQLQDQPELKAYLTNASAATAMETLVWLSGMRWPIESAILECKSELGLDQYEVRGWIGWHHHTTMTLLAHHFLVRLRRQLGQRAAALTLPQARLLLQASLPRRHLDAATALALIRYTQRRSYAAYQAHKRRRLRLLDTS